MRKGHSILGLQVISQETAKSLGKVLDLVFDHDADECIALILKERGFLGIGSAQAVPWSEIVSIGKDAVLVRDDESVINPQDHGRLSEVMGRDAHLSGTRIVTEDGRDIGNFSEIYIDEITGKTLGYEVSGGFVSDTMSGKRYVHAERTDDLRVGSDVLLASSQLADEFERQSVEEPGGLRGAYSSAKDSASDTYANIAQASVDRQKQFLIGKTAGKDVALPAPETPDTSALANPTGLAKATHGDLLIAQGEIITQEHVDRAEGAGILHQLLLAAGAQATSGAVDTAKDQLTSAQGALGGQQENLEEAAIGKPAGKDVDLPSGATLVASGMIITREMMETAKAQGKERELIAAAGLGTASEGAQNTLASAKETAGGVFDNLKAKVAELTGTAQDKKSQLDEGAQQRKINHALGRPITRILLANDDSVILNTGDIITNKAIEAARQNDVLDVLLDSVYDATPDITPEMMRATQPGVAALSEQVQPVGSPITATVDPNQPSQDTPSQGEIPARA